jgi:hypothetical protein
VKWRENFPEENWLGVWCFFIGPIAIGIIHFFWSLLS